MKINFLILLITLSKIWKKISKKHKTYKVSFGFQSKIFFIEDFDVYLWFMNSDSG